MSMPTLCATVDFIFSQSSSCLGGMTPGCPFRPLGKERGGQTTGQSFQIGALTTHPLPPPVCVANRPAAPDPAGSDGKTIRQGALVTRIRSRRHELTATHRSFRSAHDHWRDILFSWLLVRCYLRAGCRRSAFHPMRICQVRTRIPCAIPRDIATMSNLFRLPRRCHLAQTHSYGVWTSSITVITGKLTRPGKIFGGLRIETARCALLNEDWYKQHFASGQSRPTRWRESRSRGRPTRQRRLLLYRSEPARWG
jgi:hypothetical protein